MKLNKKIKEIIANKVCVDVKKIKDEHMLIKDFNLDSLDQIEVVMSIEDILPFDTIDDKHIIDKLAKRDMSVKRLIKIVEGLRSNYLKKKYL
jgi:acyl carrier protein